MEQVATYYATGRRKSSVARVWLKPGEGKVEINARPSRFFRHFLPAMISSPKCSRRCTR